MPYKSNGKWKWGNLEANSKEDLAHKVWGVWKKNGAKGNFGKFFKSGHIGESETMEQDFFKQIQDSCNRIMFTLGQPRISIEVNASLKEISGAKVISGGLKVPMHEAEGDSEIYTEFAKWFTTVNGSKAVVLNPPVKAEFNVKFRENPNTEIAKVIIDPDYPADIAFEEADGNPLTPDLFSEDTLAEIFKIVKSK